MWIVLIPLLIVGSLSAPIPLSNGTVYSGQIRSGQTILFSYNVTQACTDIRVQSTGDGDIWISRVQQEPDVYGYAVYSFDCKGDIVDIRHDAQDHRPGIYYISAFLDPLIYDSPINMTLWVIETPAANKLGPNFKISDSGKTNSVVTYDVCIPDPYSGLNISLLSNSSMIALISKIKAPNGVNFTEFYGSSSHQAVSKFIPKNSTEPFTIDAYHDRDFLPGDYFINIFPFCSECEGTCDSISSVDYAIDIHLSNTNQPLNDNITITYTPIQNNTYYQGSLKSGESAYFSIDVNYCQDLRIVVSNMSSASSADLYVSHTPHTGLDEYAWHTYTCSDTEILHVNHNDSDFEAGKSYITIYCDPLFGCQATNFTLVATLTYGRDTLMRNTVLRGSGMTPADVIDWYSVCIPSKDIGINVTATTIASPDDKLIDIIATRYENHITNYTQFIHSGIPNWNFWANWHYETRPYPGCPESFFLNSNRSSYYYEPGMYYFGLYSFCLEICNYCHSNITYSFTISASKDLSGCYVEKPHGSSISSTILDESVGNRNYMTALFLLLILFSFV